MFPRQQLRARFLDAEGLVNRSGHEFSRQRTNSLIGPTVLPAILRVRSSRAVGVFIPDIENPYFY